MLLKGEERQPARVKPPEALTSLDRFRIKGMGKAGGTGGPCGSLVLLGLLRHQGPGTHCTHSQGSGHLGCLPQASIPLDLHHGAGLGLLPQVLGSSGLSGSALLCLMLWGLSMGLRWLRGSSALASCFPPLLPLHTGFHRTLLSTLGGILASPPTQSAPLSLQFASVSSLSRAPGGGRDLEGLALMDFSSGVSDGTMGSLFVLELGTAVCNYSSCWSADFKPVVLGGS